MWRGEGEKGEQARIGKSMIKTRCKRERDEEDHEYKLRYGGERTGRKIKDMRNLANPFEHFFVFLEVLSETSYLLDYFLPLTCLLCYK